MSDVIGRIFNFPKSLWTKLDEDAKRCGRSSVKQSEAILKTYYGVEDVELNSASLEILGELVPTGRKSTRVLENSAAAKSKKKAGGLKWKS